MPENGPWGKREARSPWAEWGSALGAAQPHPTTSVTPKHRKGPPGPAQPAQSPRCESGSGRGARVGVGVGLGSANLRATELSNITYSSVAPERQGSYKLNRFNLIIIIQMAYNKQTNKVVAKYTTRRLRARKRIRKGSGTTPLYTNIFAKGAKLGKCR